MLGNLNLLMFFARLKSLGIRKQRLIAGPYQQQAFNSFHIIVTPIDGANYQPAEKVYQEGKSNNFEKNGFSEGGDTGACCHERHRH
jgi:hypothetical protein